MSNTRQRWKRRWFQLSLRAFLMLMVFAGVTTGLIARRLQRARQQSDAVSGLTAQGAVITYDNMDLPTLRPLRKVLGDDFFDTATHATLTGLHTDDVSRLNNLPSLRTLVLKGSSIRPENWSELGRLTYIKSLDLSQVRYRSSVLIRPDAMVPVGKIRQLQELRLDYVVLADGALSNLTGLVELRSLSLFQVGITDKDMPLLAELRRLTSLDLYCARISDGSMQHLSGLSSLESLNLGFTSVGDDGLRWLRELKELRELNLKNTLVTDAGIAVLQESLPNCSIQR